MQTLKRCWYCGAKSHSTEIRPGTGEKTCPKCGYGAWQTLFNKSDRRRGTRHYVISNDTVMRVGRERLQLFAGGCYKYNRTTKRTDKFDAWIPS